MTGATHFIEVYQGENTKEVVVSPILPIDIIDKTLQRTAQSEFLKTIQVWKYKLKQKA